jgi:ribosomal protein L32
MNTCPNCGTRLTPMTISDDVYADDGQAVLAGWWDADVCLACGHQENEEFISYKPGEDLAG